MSTNSGNRKRNKSEELQSPTEVRQDQFSPNDSFTPRYNYPKDRSLTNRPQSVQIIRNPDKFTAGREQRIFGSIKQRGEGQRSLLLSGSSSSSLVSPVDADIPPPIPPRIKSKTSIPDIPPRRVSRSQRSSVASSTYRSISSGLSDSDNEISKSISDVRQKIDLYNKKISPYTQRKQHSLERAVSPTPRPFRAENVKKAGSFSPRIERKRSRTTMIPPQDTKQNRSSERSQITVPKDSDRTRRVTYIRNDVSNPSSARRPAFVYKNKDNTKTNNQFKSKESTSRPREPVKNETQSMESFTKQNSAYNGRKRFASSDTEDDLKPQKPQTDLTKNPMKKLSGSGSYKLLPNIVPRKPRRPDKTLLRKIYQNNFYRFAGYILDASQIEENKTNSEPSLLSIFSRDYQSLQSRRCATLPYIAVTSLNLQEGKPLLLDFDNPYRSFVSPSPPIVTELPLRERSETLPLIRTRRNAMSNTKKKHRLSASRSSIIRHRSSWGSEYDISRAQRIRRLSTGRPSTFHEDMLLDASKPKDTTSDKSVKGKRASSAKVLKFVKASSKGLSRSFIDLLSPTASSNMEVEGESEMKSSASTSGSLFNLLGYRARVRRETRTPSIRSTQSATTVDSIPENI